MVASILDAWEDPQFTELFDQAVELNINPDIVESCTTIKESTDSVMDDITALLNAMDPPPSEDFMRAAKVVALQLTSPVVWDSRSNILVAKLLYIVGGSQLRAHTSGLYEYTNGAFVRRQALPEWVIEESERALNHAAAMMAHLRSLSVDRSWELVFEQLGQAPWATLFEPVVPSVLSRATD